jgi:hypothetical protein
MFMQRKIQLLALVAASLIAGTAGASAQGYDRQGYDRYGNPVYWGRGAPQDAYAAVPPGGMFYQGPPRWYQPLNGANHPTPSSTQGDVGPDGNNNGTLTGNYGYHGPYGNYGRW